MTTSRLVPAGQDATVAPGDLIFLHRSGPIREVIHAGQWVRPSLRPWAAMTHVACVSSSAGDLIEATFPEVRRGHVVEYRTADYIHVATNLNAGDQGEALAYLVRCLCEPYGVLTCVGIAVRMLTPSPRGLFFGRQSTGICSGLAAEMLERGPFNFTGLAAAMCPAELARALGVPRT